MPCLEEPICNQVLFGTMNQTQGIGWFQICKNKLFGFYSNIEVCFFCSMSNIRPQAPDQTPPPPPPPQQQLPPGVISVDKLFNIGLTLVLLLSIVVIGFFSLRGFWRFANYKLNLWLEGRSAAATAAAELSKKKKSSKKQKVVVQDEEEDDEEEEEPEEEEVIVVKRKPQTAGGGGRRRL